VSPTVTTLYSVIGTDLNGCANSDSIRVIVHQTGVRNPNRPQFVIFPNPAENELTVTGAPMRSVSVYTALGQLLQRVDAGGKSFVQLSLANLARGAYLVRVEGVGGETGCESLMVR
jgi:hypothetical protein